VTNRIWLVRQLRRLRTKLRQRDRKIGHRAAEVRWLNAEIRRLGNELAREREAKVRRGVDEKGREYAVEASDRALTSEYLHERIAVFLRTCGEPKGYLAVEAAMKEFDVSRATVYVIIDSMKDIQRFELDDEEFEMWLTSLAEKNDPPG
jgi:hypothetical protein